MLKNDETSVLAAAVAIIRNTYGNDIEEGLLYAMTLGSVIGGLRKSKSSRLREAAYSILEGHSNGAPGSAAPAIREAADILLGMLK